METMTVLSRRLPVVAILAAPSIGTVTCGGASAALPTASSPLPDLAPQTSARLSGLGSLVTTAPPASFIGRFDADARAGFPSRLRHASRAGAAAVPAAPSGLTATASGTSVTFSGGTDLEAPAFVAVSAALRVPPMGFGLFRHALCNQEGL